MEQKTTLNTGIHRLKSVAPLLKKTALTVFLFCCTFYTSKAQTHDDSTVVLEKNAFSVSVSHLIDGTLKLELVNNQASEISPLFMETYIKGYVMIEGQVEQSMNNVAFTDNIENVFGPQFIGLGINSLPAFGSYKTTLKLAGKVDGDASESVQIRISGTLNGRNVIWFSTYGL